VKIQLLSDLHLEANPHAQFSPAPDADLLVLAGDIGSYQDRTQGPPLAEPDWGLQRFSPLPQYASWPVPVLFVPGNHEYDGRDWDETHRALRATCERLGLIWLEREVWTHGRVRFVGTTLWSDYDALPQHPRDKLYRAANFHLQKMATQRHGALFDAAAMRELALECQAWLRDALSQPFDGTTVAVTHFAPTLHSADPRYGLTPGTAAFCNALDGLLPLADVWMHGHLHCPQDQRVGRCRIVANPLGYASKGEQAAFQGTRCVSVPDQNAMRRDTRTLTL
jgi:predicted phosphodiesterase